MGRGIAEKKLKPIFQKYPRILVSSESPLEKQNMLLQVDGIGKENAKLFVDNIPEVVKFLTECQLMNPETGIPCFSVENESITEEQTEPIIQMNSHPLYGKKIVFTGFREKELMNVLEKSYNVSFGSSISKNIQIVIVKTMEENNKKIEQAKALKIPVLTIDEFRNKYSL
jgi:NAD-dependent DNA ligase